MNHVQFSSYVHIGHSWQPTSGSNVSFTCDRCGIPGYLPAKEAEAGIKSKDDCDHHLIETILSS